MRVDAPPGPFIDKDLNILDIDVYARYKIVDPRSFLQTLNTQNDATTVLGQRINAALRSEIAERDREEIIGGDVALDADDATPSPTKRVTPRSSPPTRGPKSWTKS